MRYFIHIHECHAQLFGYATRRFKVRSVCVIQHIAFNRFGRSAGLLSGIDFHILVVRTDKVATNNGIE